MEDGSWVVQRWGERSRQRDRRETPQRRRHGKLRIPGQRAGFREAFQRNARTDQVQDSSAPMFRPESARRACAIYRKILFGVARHCFDRIFEKTLVLHRDVAARVG